MLGDRVPVSLKIFLTALAIADDLGAILVIASFYGGQIDLGLLALALLVMAGVYVLNRIGEKRAFCYLLPAVVIWGLFYYSGVHSTLSGVAMAMLIPMRPRYSKGITCTRYAAIPKACARPGARRRLPPTRSSAATCV